MSLPQPQTYFDHPHPTLHRTLRGKISGSISDPASVVEFRGLKYADVPRRWTDSVLRSELPIKNSQPNVAGEREGKDGVIYDATRHGPSCPQHPGAQAWDLTLVGDVELNMEEEERWEDELECLTACVAVPVSALLSKNSTSNKKGLPVLIFIHGGGLSMGSNTWPQFQLRRLISHSSRLNQPIIGITLNYRVGIFGFLASRELSSTGNFGFKDLVNGLRWVRHHIRGLGGDAQNLTVVGESAGGIAISTLLCCVHAEDGGEKEEALFERAVIVSGDVTLRRPRGWKWHEVMYWEQVRMLGLEGLGREERVSRLREMRVEELTGRLPLAQHFCAVVDGSWFPRGVRLEGLADGRGGGHRPRWCREVVVGDTGDDGTVLKARILDNPSSLPTLHTLCTQLLSPHESRALLSAYNLPPLSSSSSPSPSSLYTSLLHLSTDLRFHLPTLYLSQNYNNRQTPSTKCSRYHFHATNPFRGAFSGLSSHELDVAVLLQTFSHLLSENSPTRRVEKEMAGWFVRFARGEGWGPESEPNDGADPTTAGRDSEREEQEAVTVFTDTGILRLSAPEYDIKFRQGRGNLLLEIGAQKLWVLAESLQGVRPDPDHAMDNETLTMSPAVVAKEGQRSRSRAGSRSKL
ncbi:Alpha/Beta hydrolase protein [Clohesyomyces aquaticus]|uniref:Alpha/Beta hydrolase protein n=1 Tax=Clohesyomyces aquaticus TaxID=1231657 RepID=A0A1Y1ZED1_9PLEO|nr:Alpha/Beta hydrolase protein [Clohesyomyces aquaticus]